MSDPAGTTRTPYAAGWDDETCFPDESRDGAIDRALEDYHALADCWAEMWPLELELTGVCRLRVADPVCFYDSFLRRTGDLSSSQFEAISSAVVEGGVVRALDQAFESIDEIERDHERLAAILATRLATPLLRVGLGIDEIECTRLHTPVGLVRAAILSDSPAYEPSLARAEPRP